MVVVRVVLLSVAADTQANSEDRHKTIQKGEKSTNRVLTKFCGGLNCVIWANCFGSARDPSLGIGPGPGI